MDHHDEFRSALKPVFDTKNKEIYFYTILKSGATTTLPWFAKSEIENCSSVSAFDEVDAEGKPLNGVIESTNTLFVKNYFVIDLPN